MSEFSIFQSDKLLPNLTAAAFQKTESIDPFEPIMTRECCPQLLNGSNSGEPPHRFFSFTDMPLALNHYMNFNQHFRL